jgi:hypothetical protein
MTAKVPSSSTLLRVHQKAKTKKKSFFSVSEEPEEPEVKGDPPPPL